MSGKVDAVREVIELPDKDIAVVARKMSVYLHMTAFDVYQELHEKCREMIARDRNNKLVTQRVDERGIYAWGERRDGE